jgi:hypothetical protein
MESIKSIILMAHFSQLDENNIVIQVLVVSDDQEHRGEEFLSVDLGLGGRWIQTSYNTRGGQHLYGGTPFRKNFGATGYEYREDLDAFIGPKPYPSWDILNEETGLYECPVPYPGDGSYKWDEETLSWIESY